LAIILIIGLLVTVLLPKNLCDRVSLFIHFLAARRVA